MTGASRQLEVTRRDEKGPHHLVRAFCLADCALFDGHTIRNGLSAYLLPVPELRVEACGLRRAVVARARGSLPCISL